MDGFKRLSAEFYDLENPTAPPAQLAYYRQLAKEAQGPILEAMCGSGRFLVPLAEEGFDIDGFDGSEVMVAACRRNLKLRQAKSHITVQRMEALTLLRSYWLIMIPAGSFSLIDDPIVALKFLNTLMESLESGGKLVFEAKAVISQGSQTLPWNGRWLDRPEGGRLVMSWLKTYDAATQTTETLQRFEAVRDGRLTETECEFSRARHYQPDEVVEMLMSTEVVGSGSCSCQAADPAIFGEGLLLAEAQRP